MADNIFLKATFKCPKCEAAFNVKHPLKACTATITCPKCKGQFAAKFDAVPEDILKKLAAQQAAAAAKATANSTRPLAPNQQPPMQPRQEEENSETQAISFGTKAGPLAKLVVVRGIFSTKTRYELKVGDNIIGRADEASPSDIQLKDNAVSRRSVSIFVTKDHQGYKYRFTVLKATNPVTVNNKQVMQGESVFLKTKDIIRLGKSKMYLE